MTGTLELTLAAQLGTEGQLQQDQGVDHNAATPEGPRASEAHGAQRVAGAPLGPKTSVLEGNMDSGCDTKCHILLERERERERAHVCAYTGMQGYCMCIGQGTTWALFLRCLPQFFLFVCLSGFETEILTGLEGPHIVHIGRVKFQRHTHCRHHHHHQLLSMRVCGVRACVWVLAHAQRPKDNIWCHAPSLCTYSCGTWSIY